MKIQKKIFIALNVCAAFSTRSVAQTCSTLVEIVQGVECNLTKIVSTSQLLMPCTAPAGYNALALGTQIYINYSLSSCISICMQGADVDITCADFTTSIAEKSQEKLFLYPAISNGLYFLNAKQLVNIIVYDTFGKIVYKEDNMSTLIDLKAIASGVYFVRINSSSSENIFQRIIKN